MAKKPLLDAVALLKADHRIVEALFNKFDRARDAGRKQALAKEICTELMIHAIIEEEVFYPACKGEIEDEDVLKEAYVEHDGAKVLIAEVLDNPGDKFFDAKVTVLSEMIKHHVKEEEKRSEGLFAEAKKAGLDMEGLAELLSVRKEELKAQFASCELPPPLTRTFVGHDLVQGAVGGTGKMFGANPADP